MDGSLSMHWIRAVHQIPSRGGTPCCWKTGVGLLSSAQQLNVSQYLNPAQLPRHYGTGFNSTFRAHTRRSDAENAGCPHNYIATRSFTNGTCYPSCVRVCMCVCVEGKGIEANAKVPFLFYLLRESISGAERSRDGASAAHSVPGRGGSVWLLSVPWSGGDRGLWDSVNNGLYPHEVGGGRGRKNASEIAWRCHVAAVQS